MSLSDKYGGNIDFEAKYGIPKPKIVVDPSRNPVLDQKYIDTYGPMNLQRDIRIEKELRQAYINLLVDAKKYIKARFKTAMDAYNHHISNVTAYEDFKMQIASEDRKYELLYSPRFTESQYCSGAKDWFPELVGELDAERAWRKYPVFNSSDQSYAMIVVKSGTFCRYYDDTYEDYDITTIYYFGDGNIYCVGSNYLHNIPVDYLSKVLDGCITRMNNGNYKTTIPRVECSVEFEREYDGNIRHRKYIKRTRY